MVLAAVAHVAAVGHMLLAGLQQRRPTPAGCGVGCILDGGCARDEADAVHALRWDLWLDLWPVGCLLCAQATWVAVVQAVRMRLHWGAASEDDTIGADPTSTDDPTSAPSAARGGASDAAHSHPRLTAPSHARVPADTLAAACCVGCAAGCLLASCCNLALGIVGSFFLALLLATAFPAATWWDLAPAALLRLRSMRAAGSVWSAARGTTVLALSSPVGLVCVASFACGQTPLNLLLLLTLPPSSALANFCGLVCLPCTVVTGALAWDGLDKLIVTWHTPWPEQSRRGVAGCHEE